MSQAIDIVFLLENLCYGGTQRQTLELVKRMDRKRFAPSIWTLAGPTDLDDEARDAGIFVKNMGITPFPGPMYPFALLSKLFTEKPDILVPCTTKPNVWGRIMGKLAFVPVVVGTCRSPEGLRTQHENYLWRLTKHLVCNSLGIYKALGNMGMPSGRLTYIPNGVDTEYFEPGFERLLERRPRIVSVARLTSDKDHMTLLRAFARVLERHPDATLRIVGDGPQEFTLRKTIEGAPYRGRVQIVSSSNDVRPHLHKARIFALSSVRDGQPNVILEAMAMGLPVVATNVGGIPSLVQQGLTGLLTPPSDAVSFANSLCEILEHPNTCESMGVAGRRRVESEFSFTAMMQTYQKLFIRLWELQQGSKVESR